jgi:hypothetical protein
MTTQNFKIVKKKSRQVEYIHPDLLAISVTSLYSRCTRVNVWNHNLIVNHKRKKDKNTFS